MPAEDARVGLGCRVQRVSPRAGIAAVLASVFLLEMIAGGEVAGVPRRDPTAGFLSLPLASPLLIIHDGLRRGSVVRPPSAVARCRSHSGGEHRRPGEPDAGRSL